MGDGMLVTRCGTRIESNLCAGVHLTFSFMGSTLWTGLYTLIWNAWLDEDLVWLDVFDE